MSEHSRIDISYRNIARITLPVMIGQISYTMMGVIDAGMVGQLGVTALAAVGLGNFLALWPLVLVIGMAIGVNTLVAQAVGAKRWRAVGVAFFQGIYLGVILAVVMAASWFAVPTVIGWTGIALETSEIATRYMQIRMLGGLGVALLSVGENFYRGLGRTAILMWAGFGQLLLNCCLNYFLIFGKWGAPQLGASGAAWGTVFAQLAMGLFVVISVVGRRELRRKYQILATWRLDPRVLKALAVLSFPIAVQVFMEVGGISVFCAVVARLGDAEMAATNAVVQSWSIAFMIAVALSVGATTLVGQCVGAERPQDARRAVLRVMNLGYVLSALLAVVYLVFPQRLIALFLTAGDLDQVLPYARPLFSIVVICLTFDLIFNVLAGALRGAGDTKIPMWINIGSAWLLFVPATLLITPSFGLIGAWACLILHLVVMSVLLFLRFRGDAWLRPPIEIEEEKTCLEGSAQVPVALS